jgi:hypothetical protein
MVLFGSLSTRVEAPIFMPVLNTSVRLGGGAAASEPAPSLRWASVARSGMSEAEDWTTEQRGGTRADKVAAIRRRRDNNVRHHALLGEEATSYESEQHRGEREAWSCFDPDQTRVSDGGPSSQKRRTTSLII